jgi:hypothetical protein
MTEKTFTINYFTRSDGRAEVTVIANSEAEAIAKAENVGQVMSVSEHSPAKPVKTCKVQVMDWDGNIVEVDAIC